MTAKNDPNDTKPKNAVPKDGGQGKKKGPTPPPAPENKLITASLQPDKRKTMLSERKSGKRKDK